MKLATFNDVRRGSLNLAPVTVTTKSGTTNRLMNKQEFKEQTGLKGNALSIAYNAYLRAGGANAAGNLMAKVAKGELTLVSERDSKNAVNVRFVKAEALGIKVDQQLVQDLPDTEKDKMLELLLADQKARKAAAAAQPQLPAPGQN